MLKNTHYQVDCIPLKDANVAFVSHIKGYFFTQNTENKVDLYRFAYLERNVGTPL